MIRLAVWPEGLVLWVDGQVRWQSWEPFTDDGKAPLYSEGLCADGAAILRDGRPMRVADVVAALNAAQKTPAARWREEGRPDPHGDRYDGERARLCLGQATDDELANAVYLDPNIVNLTAAKDRIRWLSRRLVAANQKQATEAVNEP